LLRLAPTIVVKGLSTASDENREALLGGASYFVGELLSWTLPAILLALSFAIEFEGFVADLAHNHDGVKRDI
jgi:hypothetical protein